MTDRYRQAWLVIVEGPTMAHTGVVHVDLQQVQRAAPPDVSVTLRSLTIEDPDDLDVLIDPD